MQRASRGCLAIVILTRVPYGEDGHRTRIFNLEQDNISCRVKWQDQFAQKGVMFIRLPSRERELLEDFGRFSRRVQRVLRGHYVALQQISVKTQQITTGAGGIADTVRQ